MAKKLKKFMLNFKKLDKGQIALLIFESVMALFYPVLGILFIKMNIPQFSLGFKLVFGIILILYGIFRIYRVIKKIKKYG